MIGSDFSDVIKSLFAALGAKTSDSNYAVPLLNKTTGQPQGMMDFSNLAAVLGGKYKLIQNNDDLNNTKFRVCGDVYVCNSVTIARTITNTPADGNMQPFRLEIVPAADNSFPIQRLYIAAKGGHMAIYLRYYENSWGDWRKIATESIT